MQKLSMTKEEQHNSTGSSSNKRPPYKQPLWCLGLSIIILDACGDFVFIGLAPQSLLAPLGSLSLGWNIILAPIFHPQERVTRDIVAATALIYVGTIITILSAADTSPTYNLAKLVTLITTDTSHLFFMYEVLCALFIGALAYHGSHGHDSNHGRTKGSTSGGGYGVLHYCGIAGCLGGQCLLFAKSTSELVKNAILTKQTTDWTTSPLPYMLIVGMIGTVLTQLNFLNTGLAKFDALIVIPVYQSFWNAFGITGGLLFFREYQYMNTKECLLYGLGILITLVGVTLLVKQRRTVRTATTAVHIAAPSAQEDSTSSVTMLLEDKANTHIRHRRTKAVMQSV
jgi:hypothetical protein